MVLVRAEEYAFDEQDIDVREQLTERPQVLLAVAKVRHVADAPARDDVQDHVAQRCETAHHGVVSVPIPPGYLNGRIGRRARQNRPLQIAQP